MRFDQQAPKIAVARAFFGACALHVHRFSVGAQNVLILNRDALLTEEEFSRTAGKRVKLVRGQALQHMLHDHVRQLVYKQGRNLDSARLSQNREVCRFERGLGYQAGEEAQENAVVVAHVSIRQRSERRLGNWLARIAHQRLMQSALGRARFFYRTNFRAKQPGAQQVVCDLEPTIGICLQ